MPVASDADVGVLVVYCCVWDLPGISYSVVVRWDTKSYPLTFLALVKLSQRPNVALDINGALILRFMKIYLCIYIYEVL